MSLQINALVHGYVITGLSICSTVPASLRELRTMIATYFSSLPTTIVEPGTKTGVPLLVDNPKEIGADRIVNTLAAHTLYGGPAIVVDFGTSTNLDVVSPKGEFLGGALAPGIEISVDALAARAAQLRKVELIRPKNAIGKNTVEALQSGTIFGFAGQVDRLVEKITAELALSYDQAPTVIATGGLAPLVIDVSELIDEYEPDLTLIGLRLIHEKNL
jgi:type III pantothenate kinase